jgi:hypothetical protein
MATVPGETSEMAEPTTTTTPREGWHGSLADRAGAVGVFVYATVLLSSGATVLAFAVGGAVAVGGVAGVVAFFTGGLLGLAATPTVARISGRRVAEHLEAGR